MPNDVVVHGLYSWPAGGVTQWVCLCSMAFDKVEDFRHHIEVVKDLSVATHPRND